jgi:HEAT repeat protein
VAADAGIPLECSSAASGPVRLHSALDEPDFQQAGKQLIHSHRHDEPAMKTLGFSLLSASAILSALLAVQSDSCASPEHGSEMQIQGRPVAAWVAEVKSAWLSDLPGEQVSEFNPPNPALEVLVSAGPRVLTNLADLLLHDPSMTQQVKAEEAIGAIAYRNPGAPELPVALPALTRAAKSKDLTVRLVALQDLGAVGKAASNSIPLLVRATTDQDRSVRFCSVEALGRIGIATAQTMDTLQRSLSDQSGDVRLTAVQALYRIGHPASNTIPVLVRLTQDEHLGTRLLAIETLGRVGTNSPAANAALKLALHDTNQGVRDFAGKALQIVEAGHQ